MTMNKSENMNSFPLCWHIFAFSHRKKDYIPPAWENALPIRFRVILRRPSRFSRAVSSPASMRRCRSFRLSWRTATTPRGARKDLWRYEEFSPKDIFFVQFDVDFILLWYGWCFVHGRRP